MDFLHKGVYIVKTFFFSKFFNWVTLNYLQFASSVDVSGFLCSRYVPLVKDKHFHREYFQEQVLGQHRLSFYHRTHRVPGDRSGLKSTLAKTLPISSCEEPNSVSDARLATAALDARARSSDSFLMARDIPIPPHMAFIELGELDTSSDMLNYSMEPTPGKKYIIYLLINNKNLHIYMTIELFAKFVAVLELEPPHPSFSPPQIF